MIRLKNKSSSDQKNQMTKKNLEGFNQGKNQQI